MRRDESPRSAITTVVGSLLFATAMGTLAYLLAAHDMTRQPGPLPPGAIDISAALADRRPLDVTVTRNWKKVRLKSSPDELTASPWIWMDMHFGDWDGLPADVRDRGLARLRHRFRRVIAGPAVWEVMSAADWDAVPQPVRMVVFPLMIEFWVDYYTLGRLFQLPDSLLSDTVSAIVMSESWFQHRADVVNEWGNRDVGLGQCSNRCRRDLGRMAAAGLLDFSLDDDDYLNPWHATRAAVVWFGLELARAEGNVDLAIRAYHRGFEAARRGEGAAYAENVRRLHGQYFTARHRRSPTWERLVSWARSSAPGHADSSPPAAMRLEAQPAAELQRHDAADVQLAAQESVLEPIEVLHEPESASRAVGGRTR
jgi:hypothetical protein